MDQLRLCFGAGKNAPSIEIVLDHEKKTGDAKNGSQSHLRRPSLDPLIQLGTGALPIDPWPAVLDAVSASPSARDSLHVSSAFRKLCPR